MFRSLIAAGLAVLCAFVLCAGAAEPSVSTVYYAQDDLALTGFEENPERTRALVHALLIAVTGQIEPAKAWRSLVSPTDRVGIKISAAGGRYFATHHGLVEAIVSGLEAAGVPRDHIVVWDRNSEELRAAGYLPAPARTVVRAIDPPKGLDREAPITCPVLGKLMWGDLLFAEKQRVAFGKTRNESDQLSDRSYLARIVSREITKIINVPVLSDERGCGVGGAIYNMTIPNVDNWRRFTQTEGAISASPMEVFTDERIGPKCVLHIMDGLLAQYAGGPVFSPNYALPHQTLYASKDPVALDAVALRKIEGWRAQAKLPPIGKRAAWLEEAAEAGLGVFAEDRILLRKVDPLR